MNLINEYKNEYFPSIQHLIRKIYACEYQKYSANLTFYQI